jgi:hypothetical protein
VLPLREMSGISPGARSVELGLEDPVGVVERFRALGGIDQRQPAWRV